MVIAFSGGIGHSAFAFLPLAVSGAAILVGAVVGPRSDRAHEREHANGYSTAWFAPSHLDQVEPRTGYIIRRRGEPTISFREMMLRSREARRLDDM